MILIRMILISNINNFIINILRMGKKGKKKEKEKAKKVLPFVSICTPTFNRRPFIKTMIYCFNEQTYPKELMEWIIIDDGEDKIEDLIADHPNVKYFKYDTKMTLGKKRNTMHEKSKGDIIIYSTTTKKIINNLKGKIYNNQEKSHCIIIIINYFGKIRL